jgi:hypothetical protein
VREWLENPIIVALATAMVMWGAGWVRTFLAHRIKVSSPEAKQIKQHEEVLEKLVPAVNTLVSIAGPEFSLIIALGEAAQGKNNGNVTTALNVAYAARSTLQGYVDEASKINPVCMEGEA